MRSILCAIAPLILISAASAQIAGEKQETDQKQYQTGYCPQTHKLEAAPRAKYWFEGTIGKRTVRMYLDRGGAGVVGSFYDVAGDWTPTYLGGEWNAAETAEIAEITLSDETEQHPPTGRLQGRLRDNEFTGSWTSHDGSHVDPVRLAAPTSFQKCDGNGAWKRFDNPKWPVSFSYPASWRLEESGDAITLRCPDPEMMAYNSEVTVYEGTSKPGRKSGLVQCANGWKYGPSCDCAYEDTDRCSVPKITHRDGSTVLNLDEQEWRVYCRDGGYVGQGDGEHRIILFRNTWIEFIGSGEPSAIIDRLVTTAKMQAAK